MSQSYLKTLFRRFFGKPLEIQLVEACEAIPGLRKEGHNDELEFDYLRILELAESLRAELLPRGIVILANDLECLEETFLGENGRTTEARVKTEFTVTNGWKEIKLCSYGSARDENGFAIAIAQTMGLKALLKRISLTYGKEDDMEARRWALPPSQETTHQTRRQLAYQGRAWEDAVRNSGKTEQEIEALLSQAMGQKLTSDDIAALPPEAFDQALKLVIQHSDLTEVLEMSKRSVKRGPQPIVESLDHSDPTELAGD